MQTLGRAQVIVDGETIDSEPGAKLVLGGIVNDELVTGYNVHRVEKLAPAQLECTFPLAVQRSLEALRRPGEVTIAFMADTGQSYVVRDAFLTSPLEITDGAGGKIPLRFSGSPAEEVL